MKRTFIFLMLISLTFGLNLKAQDHHLPLTSDVNDVIGTLNGTNNNVTFATDAERGDVAVFNGTDAYIDIPSFVNGKEAVTIAVWYKADYTTEWRSLWEIVEDPDNKLRYIPSNGIDGKTELVHKTQADGDLMWPGAYTFAQGEWQHSVVTISSNKVTVYVDGQKAFEKNSVENLLNLNDIGNYLGRNTWGDYFLGSMSDFRVYNKALTDTEVAKLYVETEKSTSQIASAYTVTDITQKTCKLNATLNAPGTVALTIQLASDPAPDIETLKLSPFTIEITEANSTGTFAITEAMGGMPKTHYTTYYVAKDANDNWESDMTAVSFKTLAETDNLYHWPLSTDVNEVINGLNGTNQGATFVEDTEKGSVAVFNDGYIELPSFLKDLDEVTISLWFRMDEERLWSRFYSLGLGDEGGPGYREGFWLMPVSGWDNNYAAEFTNPTGVWKQSIVSPAINLGEWYHSVMVMDKTNAKLYLDNVMLSDEVVPVPVGEINDSENYLGKSYWPADAIFGGAMTDLRVFTKALSSEEIAEMYVEQEFISAYPNVSEISQTDAKLNVKLNKAGTVYYTVLESTETQPSIAEIMSAANTIQISEKETEYTATINNLTANTSYKIYSIAKDKYGNTQTTITSTDFSTTTTAINSTSLNFCKLYPNPAEKGEFKIAVDSESGNFKLTVFDLSGRTVLKNNYIRANNQIITVNNRLKSGFYIIKLQNTDNNKAATLKLEIK